MTSRRSFLQGSAVAMSALGCAVAPTWAAVSAGVGRRRLSVSEGFVFPEWVSAMDETAPASLERGDQAFWRAWREDSRGRSAATSSPNELTLLSLPAPGVEMFAPERARDLARLSNDRLAEAVAASRGRLAGLATLSACDPDAAEEAARAVDGLGLAGLSLGANRGLRLDHPSLRPVFAFAAAAGAPIYLPASYAPRVGDAPYRAVGSAGILAGAAEDSARHATQLIFGGVLDAYPSLRVVLGRLGEATPYWYTRIGDTYAALQGGDRPLPHRPALAYFTDNIMLTTADMSSPETLAFCSSVLGKARVLHAYL